MQSEAAPTLHEIRSIVQEMKYAGKGEGILPPPPPQQCLHYVRFIEGAQSSKLRITNNSRQSSTAQALFKTWVGPNAVARVCLWREQYVAMCVAQHILTY
jgi:hypothetical protein